MARVIGILHRLPALRSPVEADYQPRSRRPAGNLWVVRAHPYTGVRKAGMPEE